MDIDQIYSKYVGSLRGSHHSYNTLEAAIKAAMFEVEKKSRKVDVITWQAFDFFKIETRPPEPDKYLICRKDGKIHWETWNGSGWAYNHNEVRFWAKIVPPSG